MDPHGTDYVLREVTLTCREDLLALQNITMTLKIDTNCPVCRQIDPIKIMADEDHTLGAVLPIGWLPPHNSKCQGKVKLLGVEDNFEIDPKFPQSYTITVPFSPKSAMDLPAAGTPAQWWQVKCDLDRIYDRFLKTLNSWGLWDSAMIELKKGEHRYWWAVKKLGTFDPIRLAKHLDSHEFDVWFMKSIHQRHYRSCRDRVDNLLIIMRSYLKNNHIEFCYIHVHNYGDLHANIKVIAKVIGEDGVMSEKEIIYDPWFSIKHTFFTRFYLQYIQQSALKMCSEVFNA